MSVTTESLKKVDSHWAVLVIGESQRDRGLSFAEAHLVKNALGDQINFEFHENGQDNELLDRLGMAYEMAAIEGLSAYLNFGSDDNKELREQCAAGAWRAFEIIRLKKLPEAIEEKIFQVLHLSALAYCGDRWTDLRRWYNENPKSCSIPSVADVSWQNRLLFKLFDCWISLFRKNCWDDLDRIREVVAGLREDQKHYENTAFETGSNAQDRVMALRLIGLYHWAKATELLAKYMLQGESRDIATLLDKHFESAIDASIASVDSQQEILMRWLHAASRQMIASSIWWVAQAVNSRVTKFVKQVTKHQSLFELLPPQKAALQEKGLLDQAVTAIVIDMPTSGGKTLLAQFRILQALNQFDVDYGWVAYVAPTRALTSQITRRLRQDFEPINVRVEQLTGAIEIDAFEEDILIKEGEKAVFDILVATPEKLQLIIRNKKIPRPLALVVMDEAHNIEDETRGLRIELLLATIKRECKIAKFLLLMPYVEKAEKLAHWLAQDINTGRAISFGTTPWKPNERIVGMFSVKADNSIKAGWQLEYQTLVTTGKAIHLKGNHKVGKVKPLKIAKSNVISKGKQVGLSIQTAAMATILSERGTSIAVANRIDCVWKMAREIKKTLPKSSLISEKIRLVQNFLRTEISQNFEMIELLEHKIAVHHAGLSDETRALIEWLAEENELAVLCATSTISQGINFPVTSVFLSSRFVPQGQQSKEMLPRDFWNLAGRAGRMNQDSVGVVGIAAGNNANEIIEYVNRATGELISRLVNLLIDIEKAGRLNDLEVIIQEEQWEDFRCYVAHLWNEKKSLDAVLAETEQLLRNTFGYGLLTSSQEGRSKAEKLLEVTKKYAQKIAKHPERAVLADMTGFSPEGVGRALAGLNSLERNLTISDWSPSSLFGQSSIMSDLYGIMMRIPQLSDSLKELGNHGIENQHISEITKAWVNGSSVQEIAVKFFSTKAQDETKAITDACKAIYKNLVNTSTWGLSALSRLSGIDFEKLTDSEKRKINILPAMIYHGVKSEEAVLMRMNSVPRSIADNLGNEFRKFLCNKEENLSITHVRDFLVNLDTYTWERIRPAESSLSGLEYKRVWELLSGKR